MRIRKKTKTKWNVHDRPPVISDLPMEIKCSPLQTSITIQSSSHSPLIWATECNKTQPAIIKIKQQPFEKVSRLYKTKISQFNFDFSAFLCIILFSLVFCKCQVKWPKSVQMNKMQNNSFLFSPLWQQQTQMNRLQLQTSNKTACN